MKIKSDRKQNLDKAESNDVKLRWSPILIVGFSSLVFMFLIYVVGLKSVGGDRYIGTIQWLEAHFGLKLAVFLYTFIVDTLILPLSPDLVWMVAAGMRPVVAVFLVGSASTLGGMVSYFIGIAFDKIPFVKKLTKKANEKWGAYISVYGTPFLILASMLPLPFSTICTVAGAVRLSPRKVLPTCLFRFVHALVYFWLFRAGLLLF